MDPREALILSLKREVAALQTENDHLRGALHLGNDSTILIRADSKAGERRVPVTPPPVDLDRLAELESSELSKLLRSYITENEALRRENAELYSTREQVMRDQELVCRENERLLKKLEDVNSVCCRSPIIPARPTYSAEILANSMEDVPGATNVWTNPNADTNSTPSYTISKEVRGSSLSSTSGNIPQKLLKELDKRIVGSFSNIAEAYREKVSHHKRHNSWDNGHGSGSSPDQNYSPIELNHKSRKSALRRTSTVAEEKAPSNVADILGAPVLPNSHSLAGTPDSLLSGPLVDGQTSAPDTGDSVNPTTPFPPISRSSSPFVTPEHHKNVNDDLRTSRKTRRSTDNGRDDRSAHRAFGSPVSIDDDDDPRF